MVLTHQEQTLFKVVYRNSDGTLDDVEGPDGSLARFESEAEAQNYRDEIEASMTQGREDFHLSNPGDYAEDSGSDVEVEVIED